MTNGFLQNLSTEETALNSRIFDLTLGRALKSIYLSLNEKNKLVMEKVFLSDNEAEKKKFLAKHTPNFKKLFKTESENIKKELETETEKQQI